MLTKDVLKTVHPTTTTTTTTTKTYNINLIQKLKADYSKTGSERPAISR